jgi:hypothetical protein
VTTEWRGRVPREEPGLFLLDGPDISKLSFSAHVASGLRTARQLLWVLALTAASLVACSAIGTLIVWGLYGVEP